MVGHVLFNSVIKLSGEHSLITGWWCKLIEYPSQISSSTFYVMFVLLLHEHTLLYRDQKFL